MKNTVCCNKEIKAQKHPCKDCNSCQFCSDIRCRVCLTQKKQKKHKKQLSVEEQIALYEELNNGRL